MGLALTKAGELRSGANNESVCMYIICEQGKKREEGWGRKKLMVWECGTYCHKARGIRCGREQ